MRRRKKRLIMIIVSCILTFAIGIGVSYYYFGVYEKSKIAERNRIKEQALKLELGGTYYKLKRDVESGDNVKKEDFELVNIPSSITNENLINDLDKLNKSTYSRDIKANSLAYRDMFYSFNELSNDLRRYETSAFSLPLNIENGDYIDVRISFKSGLDYVVLSKKKIKNITRRSESDSLNEITTLDLSSEEILRFSSALVDAYLNEGTLLYTTVYISPETQKEAEITYPSNKDVQDLMREDPNVIQKAKIELEKEKRERLNITFNSSTENNYISGNNIRIMERIKNDKNNESYPNKHQNSNEVTGNSNEIN